MAATTAAASIEAVRQRLDLIRTRPTATAAEEFFSNDDWRTLPSRLDRLCQRLEAWIAERGSPELPYVLSDDPVEARRIALTASIMANTPAPAENFHVDFESLFRASLDFRMQQEQGAESELEPELASIFSNEPLLFQNLRTLGWVRPAGLLERPLCQALRHVILNIVKSTIQGDFESQHVFQTIQAKCQGTADWLSDLLTREAFEQQEWPRHVRMLTANCFCLVRLEEIFELVAEYPDSHTAVLQLKELLDATQLHRQLGQYLRNALIRRLNHPGANTSQIIDVYINTIRVLRVQDPTDRLLRLVAEPVRTYLRSRSDTVRCIITSLTDPEVGGDLYHELRRQDAKPLEHVVTASHDDDRDHDDEDNDDDDGPPTMEWRPTPSIFQPKGTFLESSRVVRSNNTTPTAAPSSAGGDSDILAMLVSIYGSKELFVNEYRLMLADKLLANLDYNTDKQVHTLELLKLRFGEMSMRNCEVMIKDMDDSKRTNALIREELQNVPTRSGLAADHQPVVDAVMISHIFWPTLQKDPLKHHPRIQADIDEFSTVYARLKNPRQLVWMNQLGTVQLELDITQDTGPDGMPVVETREFTCSPLLATLILHFQDQTVWSAESLSNETGVPEGVIKQRMTYWITNRVVRIVAPSTTATAAGGPVKVLYELASHATQHDRDNDAIQNTRSIMMLGDEDDYDGSHHGQAVSATAHEEEAMEAYESYIVGMLTNLGQLPLERIHNMLKMFVTGSDVRYDKTPQQLSVFLQHLCRQETLECGPDGMYRLFQK